eukprot:PhM_4_TR11182/c0_g1_i1/m.13791
MSRQVLETESDYVLSKGSRRQERGPHQSTTPPPPSSSWFTDYYTEATQTHTNSNKTPATSPHLNRILSAIGSALVQTPSAGLRRYHRTTGNGIAGDGLLSSNEGDDDQTGAATAAPCNRAKLQLHNLRREFTSLDPVALENVTTALARGISHVRPQEIQMNALGLGDTAAAVLLRSIQAAQSVESLELFGNAISMQSVQVLTESLLHAGATLRRLKIGENNITADVAAVLCRAIAQPSCKLLQLHLAENPLGADGVAHLAAGLRTNTHLTHLTLRDVGMSSRAFLTLCDALITNPSKTLRELDVKRNPAIGDAGAAGVKALLSLYPRLTTLDMSRCGFGATGASVVALGLSCNTTLHELMLSENDVGDEAFEMLAQALARPLCAVRFLALEKCGLTPMPSTGAALCRIVRHCADLSRLSLSGNDLGDDAVVALAQFLLHTGNSNSNIQHLMLSRCGVGPRGLATLLSVAAGHTGLRSLDVSQNIVGNDRDALAALALLLGTNSTMVQLHFSDNGIESDDIAALAAALQNNETSSLRGCVFGGQSATANSVSPEVRHMFNAAIRSNKERSVALRQVRREHKKTTRDRARGKVSSGNRPCRTGDTDVLLGGAVLSSPSLSPLSSCSSSPLRENSHSCMISPTLLPHDENKNYSKCSCCGDGLSNNTAVMLGKALVFLEPFQPVPHAIC